MANLNTIEGIGPALAEKLSANGINSVEGLLEKGRTASGRKEIAASTKIDDKRVLRFVNHADLMRINGIGGEMSELLEAAGVDSVPELAQRSATNLQTSLKEINEKKKLVRNVPGVDQVAGWIGQAKELGRAVEH